MVTVLLSDISLLVSMGIIEILLYIRRVVNLTVCWIMSLQKPIAKPPWTPDALTKEKGEKERPQPNHTLDLGIPRSFACLFQEIAALEVSIGVDNGVKVRLIP